MVNCNQMVVNVYVKNRSINFHIICEQNLLKPIVYQIYVVYIINILLFKILLQGHIIMC